MAVLTDHGFEDMDIDLFVYWEERYIMEKGAILLDEEKCSFFIVFWKIWNDFEIHLIHKVLLLIFGIIMNALIMTFDCVKH